MVGGGGGNRDVKVALGLIQQLPGPIRVPHPVRTHTHEHTLNSQLTCWFDHAEPKQGLQPLALSLLWCSVVDRLLCVVSHTVAVQQPQAIVCRIACMNAAEHQTGTK